MGYGDNFGVLDCRCRAVFNTGIGNGNKVLLAAEKDAVMPHGECTAACKNGDTVKDVEHPLVRRGIRARFIQSVELGNAVRIAR